MKKVSSNRRSNPNGTYLSDFRRLPPLRAAQGRVGEGAKFIAPILAFPRKQGKEP